MNAEEPSAGAPPVPSVLTQGLTKVYEQPAVEALRLSEVDDDFTVAGFDKGVDAALQAASGRGTERAAVSKLDDIVGSTNVEAGGRREGHVGDATRPRCSIGDARVTTR